MGPPLENNKRVVAIVCARSTSSRLPGKHLLEALGRPMLGHLIDRLKTVDSLAEIVVATTTNPSDDVLEEFAAKNEVGVFRGSEEDVLGRVLAAAEDFAAEVVCEVTGDCPIIDPELVDQLVRTFLRNSVDYANNCFDGLPDGMGAEVFSVEALRRSESLSCEPLDREHVTFYMRRHPEMFPAISISTTPSTRWPSLGVTLDEIDDYRFIKAIIEHFGPDNPMFGCEEIITFLKDNPKLLEINQHVRRKGDT